MKRILFLLLLLPLFTKSQITFFGQVGIPTDNGTSATSPLTFANPPIASMTTGDLVLVYCYARNASATFSNSATGGQTWTAETVHNSSTAVLSGQLFWCVYNGTWSAAPAFTFSSTTNTNAIMSVFRPTSTSRSWAKEVTGSLTSFSATASPIVAFGQTTTHSSTLSFAIWSTDDDNTWGSLSGTNWSKTSMSAQFRNTSGSDASSSFAYNIQTSTATISGAQQTELTLGNDPGILGEFIFYEFIPQTRSARSDFFKLFK